MIRAIVFDFDGVILESADIKTTAFEALFADHPEHVPAIRAYHLREAGISRHVKIRHIRRHMLGLGEDLAAEAKLADRFGEIVEQQVLAAPFVPGAREFLSAPTDRAYLVASGTPEIELRRIVETRGVSARFAGVFGSPTPKPEILTRALREHGWQPHEVVFVGDGESDRDASREVGVPFIARVHAAGTLPREDWWINDLTELPERLRDLERALKPS